MKIVVVGGSGRIGSKLVSMLTRDGREVVAASRRSGVDAVTRTPLNGHESRISEVPPRPVVSVGDAPVFNLEGAFCTTLARCTRKRGPLSEGVMDGSTVTCPLHGAQFNVWTEAVLFGPAKDPLKTYAVTVERDVGHVEVPLAQAVQGG
jgi:nitrite reductase/ring-hydroxylating ferredoxin subunit